jgi:DNA helicase II / ATP-dependent DNA helicase PcrA
VLAERGVPFFRRLSTAHEYESDVVDEFLLALRVFANPRDHLHISELARRWGPSGSDDGWLVNTEDGLDLIERISERANPVVIDALRAIARRTQRLDIAVGIEVLRHHADSLTVEERRAIYDDTEVLLNEWGQYLRRSNINARTIGGLLSSMALGVTQRGQGEGIALLTVHSAKGLEFDVVFIVGMAEGVFPDFRTRGKPREIAEEKRNAFVAITRSKRLLYISYPATRQMPWGEVRRMNPSPYIRELGLLKG